MSACIIFDFSNTIFHAASSYYKIMVTKNTIIFLLAAIMSTACNQGTRSQQMTDNFEEGRTLGELNNEKLKEISGIASSVTNPGMLWVHNDSGNEPEIYIVDEKLDIRATIRLNGIENRDWEDIAVGPGPNIGDSYVYLGDIGDNDAQYPYKYIHRFREPDIKKEGTGVITITDFETIVFKLEGPVKDTESLFIDPASKNLYLISKRENPVHLYELKYPYGNADTVVASKLFSIPFTEIVGADCELKSGSILIKNYSSVFYWENPNGENAATLLRKAPLEVPYREEPKGEAISWSADGSGFYTISEKKKKKPSFLFFYARKNSQGARPDSPK
jgi:hypothetical protein